MVLRGRERRRARRVLEPRCAGGAERRGAPALLRSLRRRRLTSPSLSRSSTPDGVKLDYYPTTGTVKTSMEHPRQGSTQMFRKNLSDRDFARVLDDPRAHTRAGYQTKK